LVLSCLYLLPKDVFLYCCIVSSESKNLERTWIILFRPNVMFHSGMTSQSGSTVSLFIVSLKKPAPLLLLAIHRAILILAGFVCLQKVWKKTLLGLSDHFKFPLSVAASEVRVRLRPHNHELKISQKFPGLVA
jgi:hypothetical protein